MHKARYHQAWACRRSAATEREFYRLLTEYGFSVLDYAEDEQSYEAATSRESASRITRS